MRKKQDEENFEEAEAQAYRAWTPTTVPSDIKSLFQDPKIVNLSSTSPPFFHLVNALSKFVEDQPSRSLPLSSTLPDMKASTEAYIQLQRMYKKRAEEEKEAFKKYLQVTIDDAVVDAFLKNSHALKLLRGRPWGGLDSDPKALSIRQFWICCNSALTSSSS
jgi:amyloid beta precursor protein binding protein 1